MGECILIVEDEPKLAQLQADYLENSGFLTHQIHDGAAVIDWVKQYRPCAITLDVMLPNKDGFSLCREIRQFSQVPIIMITARVEEIDRLLGLELQADDYLCKPFSPREMVARLKTILRRTRLNNNTQISDNVDLLTVKIDECKVIWRNQYQRLTVVECELLEKLTRHPGRIYSRAQLMQSIYDDHRIVSDRTIDSHIKKLRKKLLLLAPHQDFIQSIYGAGYKYEPSHQDEEPE